MKNQQLSGITTTSFQQTLLFENNSPVGSWATIDTSAKEIIVSGIPAQLAGQSFTIYANVSSSQADGEMLTPILININNQLPIVNTSYTDLASLTGVTTPSATYNFDITNLFIDPENQPMTYSILLSNGKFCMIIIIFRKQCSVLGQLYFTNS